MNNKALVALLSMITLNACTKPSTTTRSANNNAGLFATMLDLRQGNYQRHIDTQQHNLKQQQEILSQSQQHYLALKQQQLQKEAEINSLKQQLNALHSKNSQYTDDITHIKNELYHVEKQREHAEQKVQLLTQKRADNLAAQKRKQYEKQQLEKESLRLLIKQRDLLRKQMELLINRNG